MTSSVPVVQLDGAVVVTLVVVDAEADFAFAMVSSNAAIVAAPTSPLGGTPSAV